MQRLNPSVFSTISKYNLRANHSSISIILIAILLLCNGCAGIQTKALERISAEDQAKNEQISLASGQRTFNVPLKLLMKAIISAYANKNLTVTNVDKELGFIVAEGGEFVDPAKAKQIGEKGRIARLNEVAWPGAFFYMAGNYTIRSTANIFEKGENKNLVKLAFTTVVEGDSPQKYNATPSEMLSVWYEEIWAEIEQAIFIQRETIQE
jgi:hypothetical protein